MENKEKFHITTRLEGIFGKNYKDHIQIGKKYWWFFGENSQVYKQTHQHWNKLEITYIRSGVVFYIVENVEAEYHFELESIMAMQIEPEFFDPVEELGKKIDDLSGIYFNSERTVIVNFENSKYYG